jgi:hypothetical protein
MGATNLPLPDAANRRIAMLVGFVLGGPLLAIIGADSMRFQGPCVVLMELWMRDYANTRLIATEPYFFPTLILFGFTVATWASGSPALGAA